MRFGKILFILLVLTVVVVFPAIFLNEWFTRWNGAIGILSFWFFLGTWIANFSANLTYSTKNLETFFKNSQKYYNMLSQFTFFPVCLSERNGQLTETESQNTCGTANMTDGGEVLTPETLVRKYASTVLGVCLAHTKNFHDSEDIMQDVFVKAVKKFDTLRNHSKARSWLLKITRRKCIDYYRNSQPTQKMPDDVAAPTNIVTEQTRQLHEAISKLPDGFREPITLYYLDGRKCATVAKTLGISEEAVRSRLVRARLRLHELLLEGKS